MRKDWKLMQMNYYNVVCELCLSQALNILI